MEYKGFIVNTIEEYDAKQQECADFYGVEVWAGGRKDADGNTLPDVHLAAGGYFIPDEQNGVDIITYEDILNNG